jgi:heat shock protein beta
VIVLDDPIDEYVFKHLTEFEKKRITNVARGDFNMPEDDDTERKKLKKIKKMFEPLTKWWKELIKEEVDDVVISKKLVNDPLVVVS